MMLSSAAGGSNDQQAGPLSPSWVAGNPRGAGHVVCWVPMTGVGDARMITALPDLLTNAGPFAALGRELAEEDAEAPLISNPAAQLEITVGDVQRIAAACAKAFPPAKALPPGARIRRGSGKQFRPKAR